MAKDANCKTYRVTLVPGDNPRNEYINKRDYEGECASEKEAIEAWKTLNGLDGIGTDHWPVVVTLMATEPAAKPAPAPAK